MVLRKLETLDRASLEQIQTELIKSGFEPEDEQQISWCGPLISPLDQMTSARCMRFEFQDGWPYIPPKVFVDGIISHHVNAKGEVCLWRRGDTSQSWTGINGIKQRIQEWCNDSKKGFPGNILHDAHLYYHTSDRASPLVILELAALKKSSFIEGDFAEFRWGYRNRLVIGIDDIDTSVKTLEGRWYFRKSIDVPPTDLKNFRESLKPTQQKNFDRTIRDLEKPNGIKQALFCLIWGTKEGFNVLAVIIEKKQDGLKDKALEVAATDKHLLMLRAGSDSQLLQGKTGLILGLGALGSHIALLLAEAGIGKLKISDGDKVRPGNSVRHIAGRQLWGFPKLIAVESVIKQHAPWTETKLLDPTWNPTMLVEYMKDVDIVVDATGLAAFTEQLSLISEKHRISLVSAALYRGGAVGRIRRQGDKSDIQIYKRIYQPKQFPIIHRTSEDIVGIEIGCSDPVINASPVAVVAIASLAVRLIIDLLSNRDEFREECIQVLRELEEPPFNSIGLLQYGGK